MDALRLITTTFHTNQWPVAWTILLASGILIFLVPVLLVVTKNLKGRIWACGISIAPLVIGALGAILVLAEVRQEISNIPKNQQEIAFNACISISLAFGYFGSFSSSGIFFLALVSLGIISVKNRPGEARPIGLLYIVGVILVVLIGLNGVLSDMAAMYYAIDNVPVAFRKSAIQEGNSIIFKKASIFGALALLGLIAMPFVISKKSLASLKP